MALTRGLREYGEMRPPEDASGRYDAARQRASKRKSFLKSDAKYLSREDAHDRSRIR
jgi:hypothetical protein